MRKVQTEEEKLQRREEILISSAALFSRRGFHAVTVDDIAQEAGLSKGTIYLYFAHKEEIFSSLIKRLTDELNTNLQTAISENIDFRQKLRNLVITYMRFFEENETFFKIFQSEKSHLSLASKSEMHDYAHAAFHSFYGIMQSVIREGISRRLLREVNIDHATKVLRGIINSFTFHRVFIEKKEEVDVEVDAIIDIFMNGVGKRKTSNHMEDSWEQSE